MEYRIRVHVIDPPLNPNRIPTSTLFFLSRVKG